MIVGTTVSHYYPSKIFILSYTLVTIHIPIICIIISTINIFNRIHHLSNFRIGVSLLVQISLISWSILEGCILLAHRIQSKGSFPLSFKHFIKCQTIMSQYEKIIIPIASLKVGENPFSINTDTNEHMYSTKWCVQMVYSTERCVQKWRLKGVCIVYIVMLGYSVCLFGDGGISFWGEEWGVAGDERAWKVVLAGARVNTC